MRQSQQQQQRRRRRWWRHDSNGKMANTHGFNPIGVHLIWGGRFLKRRIIETFIIPIDRSVDRTFSLRYFMCVSVVELWKSKTYKMVYIIFPMIDVHQFRIWMSNVEFWGKWHMWAPLQQTSKSLALTFDSSQHFCPESNPWRQIRSVTCALHTAAGDLAIEYLLAGALYRSIIAGLVLYRTIRIAQMKEKQKTLDSFYRI